MIYQRPVNPSSTCKTCNYLTRIRNSRDGRRYCSFVEEYVDEDSLCPEHSQIMSENKQFTVKQLIKYLADFNPNAVIMNNINPSWFTGMGEEQIRNIENEKLNASKVWLFDDDEEAEK